MREREIERERERARASKRASERARERERERERERKISPCPPPLHFFVWSTNFGRLLVVYYRMS